MNNSSIVSFYGLHKQNGVYYLLQGRKGANAIGLNRPCTYQVKLKSGKKHCNHNIPLTNPVPNDYHWQFILSVIDDPLVDALLPVPKSGSGMYYIDDTGDPKLLNIIASLSRMSSPIYNPIIPIWTIQTHQIVEELGTSNVQPLILVGATAKDSTTLAQVVKAATYLPRKLLVLGDKDVVVPISMKRIKTRLTEEPYDVNDIMVLPWEGIGATIVRKFMRDEDIRSEKFSGAKLVPYHERNG